MAINKTNLNNLLANTGDMCLKRRAKEIILGLNPNKGDKVLDAGCGDGFYLHLMSKLSDAYSVGLDDNPKALELAKGYAQSKRLKLVKGDVLKMPFKDNTFNKIVCSEVLEHLPNDVVGLKEFGRVLQKDGLVAITVPSNNYPFLWDPINWYTERFFNFHFKDGFWAGVWNQHFRLYTPKMLRKAVKDAGFKIVDLKVLTHYGLPFNHYLLNLGYRMRMSNVSTETKASLSKFSSNRPSEKDAYQYFLDFVNWVDKYNNREFDENTTSVGIFLLAQKG